MRAIRLKSLEEDIEVVRNIEIKLNRNLFLVFICIIFCHKLCEFGCAFFDKDFPSETVGVVDRELQLILCNTACIIRST